MKKLTPITGIVGETKVMAFLEHKRPALSYARHMIFPKFKDGRFLMDSVFQEVEDFEHYVRFFDRALTLVDEAGLIPSHQPDDFLTPEGWDDQQFWHALDHARFWLANGNQQVIWCEPYVNGFGSPIDRAMEAFSAAGWFAKPLSGQFGIWNPQGGTVPIIAARHSKTVINIEETFQQPLVLNELLQASKQRALQGWPSDEPPEVGDGSESEQL